MASSCETRPTYSPQPDSLAICCSWRNRWILVYLTCNTNNKSQTVINDFYRATQDYGIPKKVRSDKGGENVLVCYFMVAHHGYCWIVYTQPKVSGEMFFSVFSLCTICCKLTVNSTFLFCTVCSYPEFEGVSVNSAKHGTYIL